MQPYIRTDRGGNKFYYKDKAMTIFHREDGPAVEYVNGDKYWYTNGKCHREDGPAVEDADGSKLWYINDVFIFAVNKDGKLINRMK